jgi:hypothetical protein
MFRGALLSEFGSGTRCVAEAFLSGQITPQNEGERIHENNGQSEA